MCDQRMSLRPDADQRSDQPCAQPRPIGEILVELFTHYQTRFPGVRIEVVKMSAEAA